MFESSFALDTPGRRSPLLISLTLQCATVATLVILPLFYIEQLSIIPSMPVPVYAPKLPHIKIISVMREAAASLAPRLSETRRIFRAPATIAPLTPGRIDATEPGIPTSTVGPGSIPDGAVIGDFQFRVAPPPAAETKPVAVVKPVPSKPTPVGGSVQAAKLIYQVKPVYPPLARQARIQGTVRLQAVIARDGTIQNLVLSSGHPLLVQSALEAVRQWRYRATTLNGENVEVMTQIDVNFTLSQ
ncbi:MAG: TonB family protein [Bryobacteraceae bacterium]|nr:TonB family protein [Bryobacteraceae bacterium]